MKKFFPATIKAGLLAGTLDILAACTQYYLKYNKNPLNVLTYVSSGVFGKDAFTNGDSMLFWGLLFHYAIAYSFTLFFFLIFPKIYAIIKNRIVIAILYGPFMWAVMQYLVIPFLSAIPKFTPTFTGAVIAILILIVCIGIPISFLASKYYQKKI